MGFDFKKLNSIDLTKIVYPITILITGLYIIPTLYKLATEWDWGPAYILYTTIFTLIPVFFICLALKKVRLKFKWSVLSVIGIILIIVFSIEAKGHFYPGVQFLNFFLTSGWDHTFFPIAFGFFFLCDLSVIPRKLWLFLLPLALMAIITADLNVIANVFFEVNLFPGPAFFHFFGVSNWEGLHALSNQQFINGLREFLHEFLTFFTLFPIVIFYYLLRNKKDGKDSV
jgi:multidrug transporter EmrE-like cation transporter